MIDLVSVLWLPAVSVAITVMVLEATFRATAVLNAPLVTVTGLPFTVKA